MFIVIDGIDSVGKATQLQLLKTHLESLGKTVKAITYPRYGEPSCSYVEKYLNGGYGDNVGAQQASLFYALDRFDSSAELKRDIEKYDYVLSDRYVSANMIHQGGKIQNSKDRQEFLNWVYELEYDILQLPKPDTILFLDVSVEVSQKLMDSRPDKAYIKFHTKKDIHEADKNHLENARNVISQVVEMQENFTRIDCEGNGDILSREEILTKIVEELT